MQFSFRKPHFWHPPNFAKTLFWHTVALFVFLKMPKKHYKTGEKTAKKKLDQFLTLDLDQFLTLETPNLGPVFNSTAVTSTGVGQETEHVKQGKVSNLQMEFFGGVQDAFVVMAPWWTLHVFVVFSLCCTHAHLMLAVG